MRKIFSFLSIAVLSFISFSQIEDPVDWSFKVEQNGDEATLIFHANIEGDWHLYTQNLSGDDGPIPTEFTFTDSPNYTKVGKTTEPKPIVEYDPNFNMDLGYFKKKVDFKQKIKINSTKDFKVKGELTFMVCNNERCLPPEYVDFEFDVKGKSEVNSSSTGTENVTTPNEVKIERESQNNESSSTNEEPKLNFTNAAVEGDLPEESNTNQIEDPITWEFYSRKVGENEYEVVAKAKLEEGWHIYASKLESDEGPVATDLLVETQEGIELIGEPYEKGEVHKEFDPNFGMNLSFYEKEVEFIQKVKSTELPIVKGNIYSMICNAERCLPPQQIDFKTNLKDGTGSELVDETTQVDTTNKEEGMFFSQTVDLDNPVNSDCGNKNETKSKGLWLIFLLGLGGGLFAIITPCVYPMIPLTVSFFTKGDQDRTKGIGRAALYGFFIFLIYFLLSVPFHVTDLDPQILNAVATSVWLNLIFFVVFVFFAFSFFGYYELTLPSKWSNNADKASNRGGFIGIFFMALTLALVSFSCTGPILGSVLAGVLKDGPNPLSAAMAGFGIGLGAPFALFAAFPSFMKSLPSSGGWLNSVKVVLGFLELALALKFLSTADLVSHWGLLKYELFVALWVLIFLGLALYLLGIIKFPHDSPIKKLGVTRITLAALFGAFAIYLATAFMYDEKTKSLTTLNVLNGIAPPTGYSWLYPKHCPQNFECYKKIEDGIAVAKELNKPILIDFTGHACVNCRKVEETIWPDQEVHKLIDQDYVLVSLYVDDKEDLPESQQTTIEYTTSSGKVKKKKIRTIGDKWFTYQTLEFKKNSQPLYALVSPDGELLTHPIDYKAISDNGGASYYAEFLKCGLKAFEKVKKK